tara:strand:+ start:249 stop:665 length:417 start_codon:yes stop_codon:yes gene_type:complete
MGLKRKSGDIYSKLTSKILFSSISKSTATITDIVKSSGLAVSYITILFIFSAGIINGLIEGSRLPGGYVIFPQGGIQTASESIVYLFTMVMGTAGFYFIYLGARESSKRRISDFYMMFGFSSVLVAIFLSLYIFSIKV